MLGRREGLYGCQLLHQMLTVPIDMNNTSRNSNRVKNGNTMHAICEKGQWICQVISCEKSRSAVIAY